MKIEFLSNGLKCIMYIVCYEMNEETEILITLQVMNIHTCGTYVISNYTDRTKRVELIS